MNLYGIGKRNTIEDKPLIIGTLDEKISGITSPSAEIFRTMVDALAR